jgi:hypothetical protein
MLEIEITTECNPQHLFMLHIESVLAAPEKGQKITCQVCRNETKVRRVGVPGRLPTSDIPRSKDQNELFKE